MDGLLAGVRPRGKRQKTQDVSFHNWAETQLGQAAENFFAALPNQSSDLSALHQFRIRGKQLRYTLELLAPAFGPELRDEHYPIVEELQEQLGRINDCVAADAPVAALAAQDRIAPAEQEILDKLDRSTARSSWTRRSPSIAVGGRAERAETLRQGLAALDWRSGDQPARPQRDP